MGDGADDADVVFAVINTIEHFDVRSVSACHVCGLCITIDFPAVGVASRASLVSDLRLLFLSGFVCWLRPSIIAVIELEQYSSQMNNNSDDSNDDDYHINNNNNNNKQLYSPWEVVQNNISKTRQNREETPRNSV